ncbi:lactonase family protein [Paenibacillus humicola]|uniref:lactonase family protein n=1 Tax=Paenibacillus humicola TaxID=3110540 RepID=UPI00237A164D|nr:lactonase family protein [Paenibacillus humicola]
MSDQLFYVGSYASESEEGILLCRLNGETGELVKVAGTAGIENPSFLALNRSANRLYAVSETSEGHVAGFAVDPQEGEFELLGQHPTLGAHPCHIAFARHERFAVVVNYSGGNVDVFPVQEDGSLGEMADNILHEGHGPRADRQEKAHPHSSIVDPADGTVIVADLGLDKLIRYELGGANGKLTKRSETPGTPAAGPRHMAFHPERPVLYVVNELDSTVSVYGNADRSGPLPLLQTITTLPESFEGENTCADIHLTKDGRFLYASNRGHDSITVYRTDNEGGLELVQHVSTGGRTPRNFALSNDERYLLAANQDSNRIVSFSLDGETGRLAPTGHTLEAGKPVCIRFVPSE